MKIRATALLLKAHGMFPCAFHLHSPYPRPGNATTRLSNLSIHSTDQSTAPSPRYELQSQARWEPRCCTVPTTLVVWDRNALVTLLLGPFCLPSYNSSHPRSPMFSRCILSSFSSRILLENPHITLESWRFYIVAGPASSVLTEWRKGVGLAPQW
jgi:hypothetical protein